MKVAMAEEKKIFRARKTMKISDRQQLKTLHITLLKGTPPSSMSPSPPLASALNGTLKNNGPKQSDRDHNNISDSKPPHAVPPVPQGSERKKKREKSEKDHRGQPKYTKPVENGCIKVKIAEDSKAAPRIKKPASCKASSRSSVPHAAPSPSKMPKHDQKVEDEEDMGKEIKEEKDVNKREDSVKVEPKKEVAGSSNPSCPSSTPPADTGVKDRCSTSGLKRTLSEGDEQDEQKVERDGKRPKVEGVELEAQLELKITAKAGSLIKLEKVVQQLVEERLRVLQLTVFDQSLQELKDRIERIDCAIKHQTSLNIQGPDEDISLKISRASCSPSTVIDFEEVHIDKIQMMTESGKHLNPKSPVLGVLNKVTKEQQSNDDVIPADDNHMSNGNSIQDSESRNEDDYYASIPVIPDAGASSESSTRISAIPGTSYGQPPLHNDEASHANETWDSKDSIKAPSTEKPKQEVDLHEQELSHPILSSKDYCFFCGKPQTNISRHLQTHETEAEVTYAFSLPEHSHERQMLLEKMKNKGNFKHNSAVLQSGKGPHKVKKTQKAKEVVCKLIPCTYCQDMYTRKQLWRHVRRCSFKPGNAEMDKEPGKTEVMDLAVALESTFSHQISNGVWKLISAMKQDEIASVVSNDLFIIQFAQSLYKKHQRDPAKYDYMRQRLRDVGRLVLCLRTEFSIQNLEQALKPSNFKTVVQAVKKVSGFDEDTHSYQSPSLVLKLGRTLRKICNIIHCRAIMAEDKDLMKSSDIFRKLYRSTWSKMFSNTALNTLSDGKYNKPSTLPFTEDVRILHQYLEKTAERAFCSLKDKATPQNYGQLAKVTLAQIIVFNRRRSGDVSKIHLKSFQEIKDNRKLLEDVAMNLSTTEQRLCNYFSRIEIMGKRQRMFVVLLTPSMIESLSLLVSKRTESDVCPQNIFLFARPKSRHHFKGQDCLHSHARRCGAKHPEHLTSSQLRKNVATLSQVLNLKNGKVDQVADCLSHYIHVHRDFYRLPISTIHLAKISKLLISMEKRQLSTKSKSLDEIEIEDKIALSGNEADDGESQSDDSNTEDAADEDEDVPSNLTVTQRARGTEDFGQDVAKKLGSRRVPKKVWSKPEVAAVMRHFRDHICKGKLASTRECNHCKLAEGPVLAQRTLQNIRDFVRNRGVATKKQSQKQKLKSHSCDLF